MDSLVVSGIIHRKARSAITVAGVSLGVALVILTIGLTHGFLYTQGKRNAAVTADILFASPSSTFGFGFSSSLAATMSAEAAEEISQLEGVAEAVPIYQYLDDSRMLDGIDYDSFARVSDVRIVEGRPVRSGNEVMIDRKTERVLNLRIGGEIVLLNRPFRVVGIYAPESLYRFKVPISTIQEFTNRPASCSLILVKAEEKHGIEEVYQRLTKRFPENNLVLARDLPDLFARGTPAIQVFLEVVGVLSAIISTIVMLLTMYSTVKERTRQIGILKSLGASKGWIAAEIEKEAIALSLIGVIAGFLLSILGKFVIEAIAPTTVQLEARSFLLALALGLFSGSMGAFYPAIRAAQQDPVTALAYE
jgi:putative ABC transport system permease protein